MNNDEIKGRLKVALCQNDIVWEDAAATTASLKKPVTDFCARHNPDILVFPETYSVGFSMNPDVSEEQDGISASWLRKMASSTGVAMIGSVPTYDVDQEGVRRRYNRCYFVSPDGREWHYDKRHLFNPSGEGKTYTPGRDRCIVRFKGWNIALNVCYDLRFPVWSRNRDNEYDLLVNIANWPDIRIDAAQILVRARAVENCSYALFCNRIGKDTFCNYNGRSVILNYFGESIASRFKCCGVTFLEAVMDKGELEHYHDRFPASRDSDVFDVRI